MTTLPSTTSLPPPCRTPLDAAVMSTLHAPTPTSTPPYDAEGAMKFTIAVVLVFGVGSIGLLGLYHCRSSNKEMSDKEADEFVKRFESRRGHMQKQDRKKVMIQLIGSIISKTMLAQEEVRTFSARPSLRPTLSEPDLVAAQKWRQDARSPPDSRDAPTQRDSKRSPDAITTDSYHLTADQASLAANVFKLLDGACQTAPITQRRMSFHVLGSHRRPSISKSPAFPLSSLGGELSAIPELSSTNRRRSEYWGSKTDAWHTPGLLRFQEVNSHDHPREDLVSKAININTGYKHLNSVLQDEVTNTEDFPSSSQHCSAGGEKVTKPLTSNMLLRQGFRDEQEMTPLLVGSTPATVTLETTPCTGSQMLLRDTEATGFDVPVIVVDDSYLNATTSEAVNSSVCPDVVSDTTNSNNAAGNSHVKFYI